MQLRRWIIIFVVVGIYCIIINPIERKLKQRVKNKGLLYLYTFLIGFSILMALYFVADLIGFGLWD